MRFLPFVSWSFGFLVPLFVSGLDFPSLLNERYAPYANWSQVELDSAILESGAGGGWWRDPDEIRAGRSGEAPPLSGLHLALDPGHIGGEWAEIEGRNFQIEADDFPVREGELVLEVARLVRAELEKLGAEVSLLREGPDPLNPKPPEAYFSAAAARIEPPAEISLAALVDYGLELRRLMRRMHAVTGELVARARLVNEQIRPDALLSLHINAAPWPADGEGRESYELVDSNHTHVLIFGCLSDAELSVPLQRRQMLTKMTNGSAEIERRLGEALAVSLGEATSLPPSKYGGRNAIRLDGGTPYLWARNLMLLRYVQCPVVLLEPHIANSKGTYPRIQQALRNRHEGKPPGEDDILVEYARAVVRGVIRVYGPGA